MSKNMNILTAIDGELDYPGLLAMYQSMLKITFLTKNINSKSCVKG